MQHVIQCNFISFISASLFTLLQPFQRCIMFLLMKPEHFLMPLLHIKSIQLMKHKVYHSRHREGNLFGYMNCWSDHSWCVHKTRQHVSFKYYKVYQNREEEKREAPAVLCLTDLFIKNKKKQIQLYFCLMKFGEFRISITARDCWNKTCVFYDELTRQLC